MKAKLFGSLLVAILAITSVAEAQTRHQAYMHHHKQYVRHEVRRGEISPKDAVLLRNQEISIARYRRRAMADGNMSRAERQHLVSAQQQLNKYTREAQMRANRRG